MQERGGRRSARWAALLCAMAPMASCGRAPEVPPTHDFGVLAWGEVATHEFVVDARRHGEVVHADGVQFDCGCATATLSARAADGAERGLDGVAWAARRLVAGEVLVVRIRVDSAQKLLADEPVSDHEAQLLLAIGDGTSMRQVPFPICLRFGIDSPVRLSEPAGLELGGLRRGASKTARVAIAPDVPDAAAAFGEPRADDPRLRCAWEHGEVGMQLAVTATIGADDPHGFHAATVGIARGEGLVPLRFPVYWRVVGGLESPVRNLTIGPFATGGPRPERSFVVYDHDADIAPNLVVERLHDHEQKPLDDVLEVAMVRGATLPSRVDVTLRWRGAAPPRVVHGQLALRREQDAPDRCVVVDITVLPDPGR